MSESNETNEIKKPKKKSNTAIFIISILIILIFCAALGTLAYFVAKEYKRSQSRDVEHLFESAGFFDDNTEETQAAEEVETEAASETETETAAAETNASVSAIDLSVAHSQYVYLMDEATEEPLASQEADTTFTAGAFTKIMTAIIAIENISDLDASITMNTDVIEGLNELGLSTVGFEGEEVVTTKDCLYGVLTGAGADCCMMLVYNAAGSEEDFLALMNEKAANLGMSNTNYVNCVGIEADENYTTVKDTALLLDYCMQNEVFRIIFGSPSYTSTVTDIHPEGLTMENTMFTYLDTTAVNNGTIIGGRDGYMEATGLVMASAADINGKEYILVTAKSDGDRTTDPYQTVDAVNIYNQIAP